MECLIQGGSQHGPWIATMAFYKAVHVVEALFLGGPKSRGRSTSHDDREKRLRNEPRFSQIFKHYRSLSTASLIARYLSCHGSEYANFEDYMPPQTMMAELVHHRLHQLEESAIKLASQLSFNRCSLLPKTISSPAPIDPAPEAAETSQPGA